MRAPAFVLAAAALAVSALACPGAARAQAAEPAADSQGENVGQDLTRPLTRMDIRFKHKDYPGALSDDVMTFRADKPFSLGAGWNLSTRVDLPMSWSNRPSADNPAGDTHFGMTDALVQALAIAPSKGKWTFAAGGQIVFPTGSEDQFTSGKWELVPTAAAIRQTPGLSPGSFVGLLVRDTFDIAGSPSRPSVNIISVQPLFNYIMPKAWFITIGPEIRIDTRHDWTVNVPFDLTIGKKVSKSMVASLQVDAPIIQSLHDYDWQVEGRIGFFF